MYRKKFLKNIMVMLIIAVLSGFTAGAFGAENLEPAGFKSYKFHMLKDKISSLDAEISNDSAEASILNNSKPINAAATAENLIINNVDGIKVIKNDLEKAGIQVENMKNSFPRQTGISVENRIRWEENGYKTNGGNGVNNSTVNNRTRLNIKVVLDEKTSAHFSSETANDLNNKNQAGK